MKIKAFGRLLPVLLALVALAVTVSVTGASADGHGGKPDRVRSKDDAVKAKLSPDLQQKVDDEATGPVAVVVSLPSSAVAQATQIMDDTHVASHTGAALVVGRVNATKLSKLAAVVGVVSVDSIQFKQTGTPTGRDPEVGNQPDKKTRNEALRAFQKNSVPFDKAPPLKTSNFDQLKSMNVLDAKTHDFTGAWSAGYTGTGVTASVLDGGADWGHPDLIGTWQTWTQDDVTNYGADPGWVGWPKAFDPYSTLVLLAAPDLVPQGLSWYTQTQSATCTYVKKNGKPTTATDKDALCSVSFATQTGPARNFSAPTGTNTHTYTFPASWTKSGTVKLGSHPDEYLLELYGERPAFLVTDSHTAGVYDTLYADLNDDFTFADEKPVTKSSPVAYRDLNGDGYTDLSGGLVYFISDGKTPIPGGPTDFGDTDAPASGDFVAWSGDFDPGIEGHGTLTASNVVGQGVINGKAPTFADLRTQRGDAKPKGDDGHGNGNNDGAIPGMVIGGAPNAKLAPMGDIYFSFGFSKQFGYLLTNEFGIQTTSNSYGSSDLDNDGMDATSLEADFIHGGFGALTTPIFSTGNGAPGFGTVTAPSPNFGIQVGASTNFGSTGWDSIANYSQVTDNDVIEWSNRGPGANGRNGVDVVADGSYAPGDATLNTVIDGRNAWVTWGGTSRSTPVAVGETALIYQAYKAAHGSFPTEPTVKTILKSSANDLGYDNFTQGAGSIDAGKAVAAAAGTGSTISPDEWRPGTAADARPRFPRTIAPGGTTTQTFSIGGPSAGWSVSDRMLHQYASDPLTFKSASVTQESTANFNAPDYLIDITNNIKAHPDADLVVIRATYPHEQFDTNGDYKSDQAWRLLAYNWTDVNHDGKLWSDANGNGVVNHVDKATSSNIDGFADIDFRRSEMEQGEYERFFYHRPGSNVLMGFVRNPAQRMADGMFIGFQHSTKNPAIDRTDFKVEIDYYKNVDWPWVTETQPSNGSFAATLNVPSDAPYGMYEGSVVASKGATKMIVPVAVTVAADAVQAADGSLTKAITFGGSDVAAAQSDQLYNNGSIFGANDWTWREESGDWRFFYFNVGKDVPPGTLFLTDTKWDDPTVTDLDTLLFGPAVLPADEQFLFPGLGFGTLDTIGGSQNAYLGSGTWAFNTSTGGPEEVVAAPAAPGVHAVVQHGVGFNGDKFNVPFQTTLGALAVNPSAVTADAAADGTGSFDVVVNSSLALGALKADAFGLSQPKTVTVHAKQDDPAESDPSTAGAKVQGITIGNHASRATFTLPQVSGGEDIDLFVARKGTDGVFHVVGSSTGPAGATEKVELIAPPAGEYEVWVYGFQVGDADTTAGNPVGIDIVQGNDLTLTGVPAGPVAANTPITLHVTFKNAAASTAPYEAELLLGPDVAPAAVKVPITIHGAK
jgi:Subtilase family